jgi:mannose-6-phosphate isomerase-like protein (cupin superfamily)
MGLFNKNRPNFRITSAGIVALCALPLIAVADGLKHESHAYGQRDTYNAASHGTQNLVLGPVSIKILLDKSNLGRDDIEVGELNLPAGFDGGKDSVHAHQRLEIFYVVEGILGHEVNGKIHTLNPGDVGFVYAGDQIRHSVLSDVPLKALVIWVPGGEADALVKLGGFKSEAITQ